MSWSKNPVTKQNHYICHKQISPSYISYYSICPDVIDEAKDEVQKLGLDPYDDFKDITENVESDLIKCILDNEEFLDTVGFNLIVLPYIIYAAFSNSTIL